MRNASIVIGLFSLLAAGACGTTPPPPNDAGVDAGAPVCGEPGSAVDDAPCLCAADCQGAATCLSEAHVGSPHGRCGNGCFGDADCGGGTRCLQFEPTELGLCVTSCVGGEACRGGICNDGACDGYCFADADCLSGHCDLDRRLCSDGTPREGAGAFEPCAIDDDCRSGLCTIEQRCFQRCSLSRQDCQGGQVCVQVGFEPDDLGECHPACTGTTCADPDLECLSTGDGGTACFVRVDDPTCLGRGLETNDGGACVCAFSDCVPGATCLSEARTGVPQGLCVRQCDLTTGFPCQAGFLCVGTASFAFCRPRCDVDADCGLGRICSEGACEYLCTSGADCQTGSCNLYSGRCEATPTTGLDMGAVCSDDAQCRSDVCLTGAGTTGYCSARCRASTQSCPDGAVCHTGGDGDDEGLCYPACDTVDDCGGVAGRTCVPTDPATAPNHCE